MRLLGNRGIVSEHVLEAVSRAGVVAQVILRNADHPLANQRIVWVGLLRRQATEALRQCQSDAMPTADGLKEP